MNTIQSPAYIHACDRIGQILNDYGRDMNTSRTPAFQYHRPTSDVVGRNVASALKRFDFRVLLETGVLDALCLALEGETELQGFRLIFLGLRDVVGGLSPTQE